MRKWFVVLISSILPWCGQFAAIAGDNASRADEIYARLRNPLGEVFVVAHRGCHNASLDDHIATAPENSRAALENCVRLGVDMMELDVHRTKDGKLVIMHDDTVDRTTTGSGQVKDLTLAEIKAFKLRGNRGGYLAPTPTEEVVPTLTEILNFAKGRIMLNLDIKDDIFDQAVAEAIATGMGKYIVIKKDVGVSDPALTDQSPFSSVPTVFKLRGSASSSDADQLAQVITKQSAAAVKPVGAEVGFLNMDEFAAVSRQAKKVNIRIWCNTLDEVGAMSVVDNGGDIDSLRSDGIAWKVLIDGGASIIQTDEPGPLLQYLKRHGLR
jgi:glycerophosphoryl diester phosphodiesterase